MITTSNIIIILVLLAVIYLVWRYFLKENDYNQQKFVDIWETTRKIEKEIKENNILFDELIDYLGIEHFKTSGWEKIKDDDKLNI